MYDVLMFLVWLTVSVAYAVCCFYIIAIVIGYFNMRRPQSLDDENDNEEDE